MLARCERKFDLPGAVASAVHEVLGSPVVNALALATGDELPSGAEDDVQKNFARRQELTAESLWSVSEGF